MTRKRDPNNPSTVWFWKDWLNDPGLRMCSPAAKGAWIDMLAMAALAKPQGYCKVNGRPMRAADVAQLCAIQEAEAADLIEELLRNGVCSKDRHGCLYSRRMIRDEKTRAKNTKNGRQGGNPKLKTDRPASDGKDTDKSEWVNPHGNPTVNPPVKPHARASSLTLSHTPQEEEVAVVPPASEPPWTADRLLSEVLSIVGLKEGRTTRYWMPPGASLHVWRWHTDHNLTCPEILEVISASHRAHEMSPPQGPKAFDGDIALFASIKFAPPPETNPHPEQAGARHDRKPQNRSDRRADESERLSRILDAAARGTT